MRVFPVWFTGKKEAQSICDVYAQQIEETHGRKSILRVGEKLKVKIPEDLAKSE